MNTWKFPKGIWSIIDKTTHKIITAGPIIAYKELLNGKYIFISFDNIHFFNFHGTDKHHCTNILDNNVKLQSIPKDYNIVPWMQRWSIKWRGGGENLKDKYLIDPSTIDVYVENGLDPEVVSLVTALNKIEGIETITSCSGHGIDCLQIDLYCDTFDAIKFLIDILPNDMVIMQPTIPSRANSITLKLSATNHNVNIGHEQADNFAKIIMEKLQCK